MTAPPDNVPWQRPVICAGEIIVDLVGRPATGIAEVEAFIPRIGGAPANVAAAIARLGRTASLLSVVTDDEIGDWQLATLEGFGVDVSLVRRVAGAQARISLVTGANDARRFTFYGEPPADSMIDPSMIDEPTIAGSAAIYLGSIPLSRQPGHLAMARLADAASEHDVPIVFDPNPRRSVWPDPDAARTMMLPFFRRASLVKLGVDDLDVLGCAIDDILGIAHPSAVVLLTDGSRGCRYWYGEVRGRSVASPVVREVDGTGAGDAFTAALTVRYVETGGALTENDLRFANAAGALATTAYGAMEALPHRSDVSALLSRGESKPGSR